MPWNKEHKAGTRNRIIEAASAAIRERGVAGVSVAEAMEAAGLTHGGFYAHFASKDELIAAAFAYASEQSGKTLDAAAAKAPAGRKLRAVMDTYLTSAHARHPERGCPLSTVGQDLIRSDGPAKQACADVIRKRLALLEELAEAGTKEERRRIAAGAYAAMLGGIFVARALGEAEGERYLAQVRKFLEERI